jgi:hypothetical protein
LDVRGREIVARRARIRLHSVDESRAAHAYVPGVKRTTLALVVSIAASAAFIVRDAHAEDDDCFVGSDDVGYGFVIPDRECKATIHVDGFAAALTSNWTDFVAQGTVETGVMWAVPGAQSLHLGPILAVSGNGPSENDPSVRTTADVSARLRSRYWVPFNDGPSLVFDLAAGPTLAFPSGEPYRYGGYFEAGVSMHGAVGAYFAIEPTVSSFDDSLATRYGLGVKTTAAGVLIIATVYVCTQVRC